MEEAETADIDNSTLEEGLSRLKAIRQQKKLEAFLSTLDDDSKPVIDTSLDRNVTDESNFLSLSVKNHIERLTGENAFVSSFQLYLSIVEEFESLPSAHASH